MSDIQIHRNMKIVRGVDVVISEACFIAMTKDPIMSRGATCATDHSVIAVRTLTPRFVQIFTSYANEDILFIIPVLIWLFIIPVMFCFVFQHETIYTIPGLVVFEFYYRTEMTSLMCKAWKPLKTRIVHFAFSLVFFVSAHLIIS